jgi:hypothetical protein
MPTHTYHDVNDPNCSCAKCEGYRLGLNDAVRKIRYAIANEMNFEENCIVCNSTVIGKIAAHQTCVIELIKKVKQIIEIVENE